MGASLKEEKLAGGTKETQITDERQTQITAKHNSDKTLKNRNKTTWNTDPLLEFVQINSVKSSVVLEHYTMKKQVQIINLIQFQTHRVRIYYT